MSYAPVLGVTPLGFSIEGKYYCSVLHANLINSLLIIARLHITATATVGKYIIKRPADNYEVAAMQSTNGISLIMVSE